MNAFYILYYSHLLWCFVIVVSRVNEVTPLFGVRLSKQSVERGNQLLISLARLGTASWSSVLKDIFTHEYFKM